MTKWSVTAFAIRTRQPKEESRQTLQNSLQFLRVPSGRPATQKVHRSCGPGLDAGGEKDASYAPMRKESQIFKIVSVTPNPSDLIFTQEMA